MSRLTRVAIGAAILLVVLVVVWTTGSLDRPLSSVGLNYTECARNDYGTTFCGDELRQRRDAAADQQRQLRIAAAREAQQVQEATEDPYLPTDGFVTPSGAIACVALQSPTGVAGVRCGLRDPEATSFEVFEDGKAQPVASWSWPDGLGHLRTVGYDRPVSLEEGSFVSDYVDRPVSCVVSETAGVRCRNRHHGFRVSRQRQYSFTS